MTKRKTDIHEDCLRTYVHSFHARNLKQKWEFIHALQSEDSSYAKGYAYGLNEALDLLQEIAMQKDIPLDTLGFESTGLDQLLSIVERSSQ